MSDDITYVWGSQPVDVQALHRLLGDSYWAKDRSEEQIARSVRNSFCISAWCAGRMVGFARLVTDFVSHAYLADVIVDPAMRRRGIAKRMVRLLIDHEAVATCGISLNTRDAHAVYRPFGFSESTCMSRRRRRPAGG